MFWFAHDFYCRLKDLSKLVFHVEPELEIENYIKNIIAYEWKSNNRTYTFFIDGSYQVSGPPGFSNLVPMVLAEVN